MTTTSPQATGDDDPTHAQLHYQVAVFARRMEQLRLGAVGSPARAGYLLLDHLQRRGPANVKTLAEALGIDSSTVTRQAAPLISAGLVDRLPHPADRRTARLALTPLGSHRLGEVRADREELMRRLTAGWPAEEQQAFCQLLARFNDSLELLGSREGRQGRGALPISGSAAGREAEGPA